MSRKVSFYARNIEETSVFWSPFVLNTQTSKQTEYIIQDNNLYTMTIQMFYKFIWPLNYYYYLLYKPI